MRWGIIAALVFCCGFCLADESSRDLSSEEALADLLVKQNDRLLLSSLEPEESYYHLAENASPPTIRHKNKISRNALWAHPTHKKQPGSRYAFKVPKNAKSLKGIAVVNQGRIRSQSPLTFKILDHNGNLLWSTRDKPLRMGGDGRFFSVPVQPDDIVRLEVHGNRRYGQSHAAWFEPQFVLNTTSKRPPIVNNSVDVDVSGGHPIIREMAKVSLHSIGATLGKDEGGSTIKFDRNGYFANAYQLSGEYLLDRFRGHRVVPESGFNRELAEFSREKYPKSILEFNLRSKHAIFGTNQYKLGERIAVQFDAERAAFDIANKDRYARTGYLPSDIFAIRRKSEAWVERRAGPLGLSWGSSPDTNSAFTRVPKYIIYCTDFSDLIPLDASFRRFCRQMSREPHLLRFKTCCSCGFSRRTKERQVSKQMA